MKLYDVGRIRYTVALAATLAATMVVAYSTRTEAMRPQDFGNVGCMNMGSGYPFIVGDRAVCVSTPTGADCHVCNYDVGYPTPWFEGCAERYDGSGARCRPCSQHTNDEPECTQT